MIDVTCACGYSFTAEDRLANKTVLCPKCKGKVAVDKPIPFPLERVILRSILYVALIFGGFGVIDAATRTPPRDDIYWFLNVLLSHNSAAICFTVALSGLAISARR